MLRVVAVFSTIVCLMSLIGCFGPFDPTNPPPDRTAVDDDENDDTSGTQEPVSTPGLLAWWKCDGTSESELVDEQGSFNGTVLNCTRESGVDGTALRFDGTSSYVSVNPVAGDKSFNFQKGDFTVSLWIKPMILSMANDTLSFITRGVLRKTGFVMTILENRYAVIFGEQIKRATTNEFAADAGEWRNVVLTRSQGDVTLFVNGTVVVTDMFSDISIDFGSSNQLLIGRDTSTDIPNHFNGLIDEIKILNIAWDAADVNREYQRFPQ